MKPSITSFIESGILELYVMGAASPDESLMVESMAAEHPEVQQEIATISQAMESYAQLQAVKPKTSVKALLLATIDYMERMEEGELPVSPPILTEQSKAADYAPWLNREDMGLPDDAENIYAKIIGYTPTATTVVAWLKDASDIEVHHDEYERFLILEGTCQMIVDGEINQLKAGDYFAIPLHSPHMMKVTSDGPCKAVLQRLTIA